MFIKIFCSLSVDVSYAFTTRQANTHTCKHTGHVTFTARLLYCSKCFIQENG